MRLSNLVPVALCVLVASVTPAAAEGEQVDFVCWDYDNGETECVDIDEFRDMCEGIEDWGICKDVLGLEGGPNYTSGPMSTILQYVGPRRPVPVGTAMIPMPRATPATTFDPRR